MKIDKAIKEYLFYCEIECGFSVHTISAYRSDIDHYFRSIQTRELSKALTVESLKSFLSSMLKEKELSIATARRRIASLRGFSRFVSSCAGIEDPFQSWSPSLKRPKRLPRALALNTVRLLIKLPETPSKIEEETIFCVLLLGATGLRVSELCNIHVRDISKDGSSIHVLGKGAKDRIVYVGNKNLMDALTARRSERLREAGLDATLLLNSRGNALQPQTLRRRLHRITSERGFSTPVTPHRLRHTAATMLLENGADVRFVQRQLGHASISTTEIYTHVTDGALKRAISKADPIAGIA